MSPKKKYKLFLVFDGVENTVFYNQIYLRIKDLTSNPSWNNYDFVILTLEKEPIIAKSFFEKHYADLKRTSLMIWQRLPLLGSWTLNILGQRLATLIKEFSFEKVFCRGEIAALTLKLAFEYFKEDEEYNNVINLKSNKNTISIKEVMISIPGIISFEVLLEDHALTYFAKLQAKIKKWFLFNICEHIEATVFNPKQAFKSYPNVKITYLFASNALKNYVLEKYNLYPAESLVDQVLIKPINALEKLEARTIIRQKHKIPLDAEIYCYTGGMQIWQSFYLNIEAFIEIKKTNKKAFFLILTQHEETALRWLKQYKLDKNSYLVLNLNPEELPKYHLAADFGIIFREPNIVNWTSRPIKAVEYKQAGLLVLHNYTIDWIIKNC